MWPSLSTAMDKSKSWNWDWNYPHLKVSEMFANSLDHKRLVPLTLADLGLLLCLWRVDKHDKPHWSVTNLRLQWKTDRSQRTVVAIVTLSLKTQAVDNNSEIFQTFLKTIYTASKCSLVFIKFFIFLLYFFLKNSSTVRCATLVNATDVYL